METGVTPEVITVILRKAALISAGLDKVIKNAELPRLLRSTVPLDEKLLRMWHIPR